MIRDLINFFKKQSSKDIAKERLKLVLVHDRSGLSPDVIEDLKRDIMAVIEKYLEIQTDELEISIKKTGEGNAAVSALMANIPIKNFR